MSHLHLVTVHYRCEGELRRSLASVEEDLASSTRVEELTAWVVDNGRTPGASLEDPPLPLSPKILDPGENLGFGKGCNLALREIREGLVLFLNPDTRVLPGTLDALVEAVEGKRAAAGARLFLDDELFFTVSEPLLPGPFLPFKNLLKKRLPALGIERRELKKRLSYVTTQRPGPVEMLCGACMIVPRAGLEEAGLFHEGFFMYGEDADLVLRLRQRGYRILHQPAARVIHYYDRSARQEEEKKEKWIRSSHELLLSRNYSRASRVLADKLHRAAARLLPDRPWKGPLLEQDPDRPNRFRPASPPPWEGPWFFEFSEGPFYDITACALADPEGLEIPEPVWRTLVPKRYWTRLSSPGMGGPVYHGHFDR